MRPELLFPKARTTELVIQEIEGETLVYDLRSDKAHCLNGSAARVWKLCDGETSIAAMTEKIESQSGAVGEDFVRLGLSGLAAAGLLDGEEDEALLVPTEGRRAMLKRAAVAMVAVPAVMSLLAPNALASASCACVSPGACITQTTCPSQTNCNASGVCAP
jgi:hypothetical protein